MFGIVARSIVSLVSSIAVTYTAETILLHFVETCASSTIEKIVMVAGSEIIAGAAAVACSNVITNEYDNIVNINSEQQEKDQ